MVEIPPTNPEGMKNGDIVKWKHNGKTYKIKHIHKLYNWIQATPYGWKGRDLYNQTPHDFTLIED